MRNAPSYTAERFPGDFAGSLLCGLTAGATLGTLVWWLSRRYLETAYPHHAEMLGAAVVAGVLDGALLAVLAFVACFAARVWRFERRARKASDATLRRELADIAGQRSDSSDASA